MDKKEEKAKKNETYEEVLDDKIEKDTEGLLNNEEVIKCLKEEIESLKAELDGVRKQAADIVNRGKQQDIDRKYACVGLIRSLLVPLAFFEGALKFTTDDEVLCNFLKGFEMIYNLIIDTLEIDGLKEIETDINDPFDPRYHEVTELVEITEGKEEIILEIVQKGYTYKERVIKPVQVKVSALKKEKKNNENSQDEFVN